MLRMVRDLLDQQIIDAQGRKVVRINDVTFERMIEDGADALWVLEIDIGIRSIFRRLLQGVVPPRLVRRLQGRIPPNSIRWEFCNIIEPDPQRRLRLNISNRLLEDMHPADLADIVEELSPEDRESIFENIDSEVAADALTEVDPDIQASILESLETETAADIVEEMSPDHAADALSELGAETSEEILEEMENAPKTEVRELLEFEEDTAGGMMNTEFVSLHEHATVADALQALKQNEDLLESLNTMFLVDAHERLKAAVPLARLFLHEGATELGVAGVRQSARSSGDGEAGSGDRDFRQVQPADASGGRRRWETCGRDHGGRRHHRAAAALARVLRDGELVTGFHQFRDFLPVELALRVKRNPSVVVHVGRLEETRIFEKNSRFALQDFEGDGGFVLLAVKNAEWLFLEAKKGMSEVGGFDRVGQGEADFSKTRRSFLPRESLDAAPRVFGHSGQRVGVRARFDRGVERHAIDVIEQALGQAHRGCRFRGERFHVFFDARLEYLVGKDAVDQSDAAELRARRWARR